MAIDNNKKADNNSKKYGIWAWVGAIYGPIIFWVLFVNLQKLNGNMSLNLQKQSCSPPSKSKRYWITWNTLLEKYWNIRDTLYK